MSESVRIFTPPNPLARTLVEHGRSARDIVVDAETRAQALAEITLSVVRGHVRCLATLRPSPDEVRSEAIADAAMGVAELAEAAHRALLGDAARSILALMAAPDIAPRRLADALNVHITAIEYLAGDPEPSAAEQEALLERLAHLLAHVSPRPNP